MRSKRAERVRYQNSNGWNSEYLIPYVNLGAGAFPVQNLDSASVTGLVAQNATVAQQILLDLCRLGSTAFAKASVSAAPKIPSSRITAIRNRRGATTISATGRVFVKDDWKIRPDLTLNVGVRYEFFGVPWEASGLMAVHYRRQQWLYGISSGSLTAVQFVGKNSPNPDLQVHKDDWNNFGPAVGLSWQLPWLGQGKTVLRAGYGINYNGAPRFNQLDTTVGLAPGPIWLPAGSHNYTNLATVANLLPVQKTAPLQPIPLTDRTQDLYLFDTDYVRPYIQNFNFELQRELTKDLSFDIRYVGTKGSKLYAGQSINEVEHFRQRIARRLQCHQNGGNAPLFDKMLAGLNVAGFGVVNGTTLTGSAALRQNTTTRSFIATAMSGRLRTI